MGDLSIAIYIFLDIDIYRCKYTRAHARARTHTHTHREREREREYLAKRLRLPVADPIGRVVRISPLVVSVCFENVTAPCNNDLYGIDRYIS